MSTKYQCLLFALTCGCGFQHGSLAEGDDTAAAPDAGDGPALHTSTFQQGVNGYTSAQDTFLEEKAADGQLGADPSFAYDLDSDHGIKVGLLRFDGLSDAIPADAVITLATVTLDVSDAGDRPGELHAALVDWSQATTTWNDFGGDPGVQADEIGPMLEPLPITAGMHSFDVTSSLAASLHSGTNLGWVLAATSTNGVEMRSSEYDQVAQRPSLVVTWHR